MVVCFILNIVDKNGNKQMFKAKFTVREFEDGRKIVTPEILEINKGKDFGLYSMTTKKPPKRNWTSSKEPNPSVNGGTISIGDLADFVNTFDNKVSLDKLKNLKDRIHRLKNSAYKTEPTGDKKRLVSQETIDMLDNIYSSLVNAEKGHSPQLKFANEFYSDMKNVGKELADLVLD